MRIGGTEQLRHEVLAMKAASSVLPVPQQLDFAELTDGEHDAVAALLLTRLPGRPAGDLADVPPLHARRLGEVCGRLHELLAAVEAPQGLRPAPPLGVTELVRRRSPSRLLHLDLHPFNVLVDKGEVSGVIDWANAAAGAPELDRARTWSVSTFDPEAASFRRRPAGAALLEGWSVAARWVELSATARAWAREYMMRDLRERYPALRLDHLRS